MNPREIIAQAWVYTMKEGGMRKWGFISSLLATLLNIKLLVYQTWFLISYIQGDPIGFFTIEAVLHEHLPFWAFITVIVLFIILLVIEWLFPHLAKGAIIGLAAKSHRKEEVKGGLVLGIYNFFPLFAAHELLVLSGVPMTITLSSLAVRYGGNAAPVAVMIIVSLWMFSNIMEFFWIFVEEAIVIRKSGVKGGVAQSVKLVISHLGHVVFLMLLLFFIILRIIGNMITIILIPGIVLGLGFLLTNVIPGVVSYTISTLVGLLIVGVASYFFAYLDVFRQTVWTLTYMELSKLKELDVIEDES